MIDHLLGRPSPSWKRAQVCLFPQSHTCSVLTPHPGLPRLLLLDLETHLWKPGRTPCLVAETVEQKTAYVHSFGILSLLTRAAERFSPWQIIVSTLTTVYALKHLDKILGLGCKRHPSLPQLVMNVRFLSS